MKYLLTLLLVVSTMAGMAQLRWLENQDMAKSIAIKEQKFIVMDFWATWCGPCKLMDREMWQSSEINSVASKFVPLKIDVDHNRALASVYGARSIPLVVVVDPLGNVVWKQVGYSSKDPFYSMFKNLADCDIPADALEKEMKDQGDPETWMSIGRAYQLMGNKQTLTKLQTGMLSVSDQYFRKVIKKSADPQEVHLAELQQILNDAYRGRAKNALKQLAKLDGDNSELENYIMAYCYKCMGNKSEMEKYKKLLKNQEFLAQLQ